MEYTVSTIDSLKDITSVILELCREKSLHVVLLSGDLGAGKTTLTQEISRQLGVSETVNSPTFVIRKSYELENQTWKSFVHADLYRLEKESDLDRTGIWNDLQAEDTLVCIEWPEQIEKVKEFPHIAVQIEHGEGEKRKIIIVDNS